MPKKANAKASKDPNYASKLKSQRKNAKKHQRSVEKSAKKYPSKEKARDALPRKAKRKAIIKKHMGDVDESKTNVQLHHPSTKAYKNKKAVPMNSAKHGVTRKKKKATNKKK